jgi:hypothetical protein
MKRVIFFLASLTILITGCGTPIVKVTPTARIEQTPDSNAGYVAGLFTVSEKVGGVALGLVNLDTDAEYLLPIGEIDYIQDAQKDALRMIAVPPGKYRLAFWTTYNSLNQQTTRTEVANATRFTVAPGGINFLGRYQATSNSTASTRWVSTRWELAQSPITLNEARKSLSAAHPAYLKLNMVCPRCLTGKPAP